MTKSISGKKGRLVTPKPRRAKSRMVKEQGMRVMKTGKLITIEDVNAAIEAVREERHRHILGPWLK